MKRLPKLLVALACCLLCSVFASAQNLEFAYVTGENVNIRKSPSTSAPRLMYTDRGVESSFYWERKALKEAVPYYPYRTEVMQIVGKADGWLKVRFDPGFGLFGDAILKDNSKGYRNIEGWMSGKFLKTVSPVNLTWQNVGSVLGLGAYKCNKGNLKNIIFIQDGCEGVD